MEHFEKRLPPMPAVSGVDPTGLGTFSSVPETGDRLCEWIIATVPPDPRGFHPGKDFASFVRSHFERGPDAQVLTLPAGTRLSGDLELDWDVDWVQRNRLLVIACEGDLTIDGDVLNREMDSGPLLLVGGDLSAQAYFVLDQSCWVCGTVRAPELNDREMDMHEELLPELFASEDDTSPEALWLWARQRAGLPILKAEA